MAFRRSTETTATRERALRCKVAAVFWHLAVALFLVTCTLLPPNSAAAESVTPWVEGYKNRLRLHVGAPANVGAAELLAGIEIAMPPGWKTYWRNVGDAGGIPPEFDWSESENVRSVEVLYPAPRRIVDKAGAVIGYLDQVLFPARIHIKDTAKPVILRPKVNFGVCEKICVPVQAALEFEVAPGIGPSLAIEKALERVPGKEPDNENDPQLKSWKLERNGDGATLVFEVVDPAISQWQNEQANVAADAFIEGPAGIYLPLPEKQSGGGLSYEVNLTEDASFEDLRGEELTITLVGATGQSENRIKLE